MSVAAGFLAVLLAAPANGGDRTGDILCLKDGRIVEGKRLERTDGGVLVHFEAGAVLVPAGLVLECVVEGDSGFVPRTDEEREKAAEGLVPYDGEWMSPRRRDRLLEKRLEAQRERVQAIKATRLWRNRIREETEHFAFEATVPRHVFELYRDRMEAYFTDFARLWRVRPPRETPRLKVCFYGDRENYLQVTGTSPNVLGYFRFVDPMELNIYYDRLDPLGTEEVMFHEANHYLQKLIDVDFSYPHWPGEALAEYYAGTRWDADSGELVFGLVLEGRLTEVKQDIAVGDWKTIRELATEDVYEDYTWGWSLVHFLMEGDERRAKRFREFYVGLAKDRKVDRVLRSFDLHTVRGEEVLRSFRDQLDVEDDDELDALQAEWHRYVDQELQVSSARGLEEAAWRSYARDRKHRARRLFGEAIEGGTENPLTFHRFARLLSEDDEHATAHGHWRRALALDPLTSEFYVAFGRALIEEGDAAGKEEGKRLLRLGAEIDPDDPWLERNLGRWLKK